MKTFIQKFTQNNITILIVFGFFSMFSNSFYEHDKQNKIPEQWQVELPTDQLQSLSFGFSNFIAVSKWIETIALYGDIHNKRDYIKIFDNLDVITSLNPLAKAPYYLAAMLPWDTGSTTKSSYLLDKAIQAMPDIWYWPFYKGFSAYWFDHNREDARKLLEQAAALPHAPPLIVNLALRMAADTGKLEGGLMLLEQLLENTQDHNIREHLIKQRQAILTEQILREVDLKLAQLPIRLMNSQDLIRLQQSGYPLPDTLPDGGHIIMNAKGIPVSSISRKRFKVFVPPKRQKDLQRKMHSNE